MDDQIGSCWQDSWVLASYNSDAIFLDRESVKELSFFKTISHHIRRVADTTFCFLLKSYRDRKGAIYNRITQCDVNLTDKEKDIIKKIYPIYYNSIIKKKTKKPKVPNQVINESMAKKKGTPPQKNEKVKQNEKVQPKEHLQKEMQEQNILQYIENGTLVEDIMAIFKVSREYINQLTKGKEEKEFGNNFEINKPRREVIQSKRNKKVNQPKKDNKSLTQPTTIISPSGENQYQKGGPAACTVFACHFLKRKEKATPEGLKQFFSSKLKEITGDMARDTEKAIKNAGLELSNRQFSENDMAGVINAGLNTGLIQKGSGLEKRKEALQKILQSKNDRGAIFIANDITIAMRIWDDRVEFFDPHGDNTVTKGEGNPAYVRAFPIKDVDEMHQFLKIRYPYIEGMHDLLQIYVIKK